MHHADAVFALKNDICLFIALGNVAAPQFHVDGDVGGLITAALKATGPNFLMDDWRVILDGVLNLDDGRKRLVVDLDEIERLFRDMRGGGRDSPPTCSSESSAGRSL